VASAASAIIFYPLNIYLILVFGWRTALAILGFLAAVVTLPLAVLAIAASAVAAWVAAPRRAQATRRATSRLGP
jgi:hypothetical protein